MHEASAYGLLQLSGPSALLSGPPTSLAIPPPPASSFFGPFPPAAAALYQAGLLVNMYAAAAAVAFSAASNAPCPDMLSPLAPASSVITASPALDLAHTADRTDPSLISPGNDRRRPMSYILKVKKFEGRWQKLISWP